MTKRVWHFIVRSKIFRLRPYDLGSARYSRSINHFADIWFLLPIKLHKINSEKKLVFSNLIPTSERFASTFTIIILNVKQTQIKCYLWNGTWKVFTGDVYLCISHKRKDKFCLMVSTRCCRWLYQTSMHVPSASTWAHKKGTNSNRTAWAIVLYLGTVFTGGNTQKPKN